MSGEEVQTSSSLRATTIEELEIVLSKFFDKTKIKKIIQCYHRICLNTHSSLREK
jgi:hypothetical protein